MVSICPQFEDSADQLMALTMCQREARRFQHLLLLLSFPETEEMDVMAIIHFKLNGKPVTLEGDEERLLL